MMRIRGYETMNRKSHIYPEVEISFPDIIEIEEATPHPDLDDTHEKQAAKIKR